MEQPKSLFDLSQAQISEVSKDETAEEKARELLAPYKIIRDAVHGDIKVTKLEVVIIDTEEFQRLRMIKQLGLTNLVYPCATHTRFDHSLGTLHMAQCLIDQIKTNPYPDPGFRFTDYHTLLTRVCALVHDLAHVPFGHTIEDEGNLVQPQWFDKDRVNHFLGDKSTVGSRIIDTLNEKGLDGEEFLAEVRSIVATHREEVKELRYPFIYDIVQNTICADLLDYLQRDLYFCGLREAYDPRFLSYFYVTSHEGKWRLVLRLTRPREQTLRRDVISETLHLLRLRYSLAEKVYYHHAKIKASAMMISAVGSALRNKIMSDKDLYKIGGDDALLARVSQDRNGSYILEKLRTRKLYRFVYSLSFVEERLGSQVARKRREIIEKFQKPALRYEAERTLEDMNFLERGQVLVYCPGPEMGHKAAETLVEWETGRALLREVPDDGLVQEIKTSIEDKHKELWRMYVLVDPGLNQEQQHRVASDCAKDIVGEMNEITEFRQIYEDYLERYKAKAEQELGIAITSQQIEQIRSGGHRYDAGRQFFGHILTYDYFKELLGISKSSKKSFRSQQ